MLVQISGGGSDRPFKPSTVFLIVRVQDEGLAMEFGQLILDDDGEEEYPIEAYTAKLFIRDDSVLAAAVRHVFAGNSKIVFRADPSLDYEKDLKIFT